MTTITKCRSSEVTQPAEQGGKLPRSRRRKKPKFTDTEAILRHELAHAFAAWRLGLPLVELRCRMNEGEDSCRGVCTFDYGKPDANGLRAVAIISYSGPMHTAMTKPDMGFDSDTDFEVAEAALRHLADHGEPWTKEEAWDITSDIVDEGAGIIEQVARSLLPRGSVAADLCIPGDTLRVLFEREAQACALPDITSQLKERMNGKSERLKFADDLMAATARWRAAHPSGAGA